MCCTGKNDRAGEGDKLCFAILDLGFGICDNGFLILELGIWAMWCGLAQF
jgi:hypothetical protein